ncbi:prepilin-type N-terminal cleavage/methylation domain-containing protein [bacterium]|nr:MAG: prepilin-type N-terminal cleavage/methylation domain-containing protein [bacterium]
MENKIPIPQPKSPAKFFTTFKRNIPEKEHGFTLIELIVVIIIVGILAALGISQYSLIVEKSRLAEAKIRIGTMRQLAYEYYLNNGSMTGIMNSDVGVDATCSSTSYYGYLVADITSTKVNLFASRCSSGGKTPNASNVYNFYLAFYPNGESTWHCFYANGGACFGFSEGAH